MRLRREHPFFLGDVLLQDVRLQRAVQRRPGDALPFGGDEVESEQDDRRSRDGHRRRNLAQRDAGEQMLHVFS